MNDLVVVLFFGLFLSAPLWMTWGAGKVSGICARSGPGGGAEPVAVVFAVVLLFVVAAGAALISGV
ncbi:hypothetical protein ME763_07140 [Streptomyces murinus]|uniref:hypothetical protein n=1 Tax=Streptomyces murinus TaxID=33900 RepID=UPI000A1EA3A5|nr:hypothetical protein [Streptomyces murinus]WDO05440.1 hypothetical protein ME763_07140 [Streptomyces murinus]